MPEETEEKKETEKPKDEMIFPEDMRGMFEDLSREYRVSPDEVLNFVIPLWKSASKDELIYKFATFYFSHKALSEKLHKYEQIMSRMDIRDEKGETVHGSELIGQLRASAPPPVYAPPPQPQDDHMSKIIEQMMPIILLQNLTGNKGNESNINMVELLKMMKEMTTPQQQKVQIDIGDGKIIEVTPEIALMMMSQQQKQGLTKEDIQEIVAAASPQQPDLSLDDLRKKIRQDFLEDKKFWEEYYQSTGTAPPEVLIEKEKQETERKKIETSAHLEEKRQELKKQEIAAQQLLVQAIMNPEMLASPGGQKKKTLEDIGKGQGNALLG